MYALPIEPLRKHKVGIKHMHNPTMSEQSLSLYPPKTITKMRKGVLWQQSRGVQTIGGTAKIVFSPTCSLQ